MPTRTLRVDAANGVMAIMDYGTNAAAVADPNNYLSSLKFHSGLTYAQIFNKASSTTMNFTGVTRNYVTWDDGSKKDCCVLATAAFNDGSFTKRDYLKVNAWAIKVLDKTFIGERFHRGYHVIASKICIPLRNTIFKDRIDWLFENGVKLLMSKKFDIRTLPELSIWLTLMLTVGLVVTRKYSDKCWHNLYRSN